MKTLVNNENQTVQVNQTIYNEIYNCFIDGGYFVVASINGVSHVFILPDNFR